MKAMWLGFVAVFAIAAVAGVVLDNIDYSSAERYSTSAVRLH